MRNNAKNIETLKRLGNLAIGTETYNEKIKKYGSEEAFMVALSKEVKSKCTIRFCPPCNDSEFKRSLDQLTIKKNSKKDKGFYVIEME